jgi:hypothetical protein
VEHLQRSVPQQRTEPIETSRSARAVSHQQRIEGEFRTLRCSSLSLHDPEVSGFRTGWTLSLWTFSSGTRTLRTTTLRSSSFRPGATLPFGTAKAFGPGWATFRTRSSFLHATQGSSHFLQREFAIAIGINPFEALREPARNFIPGQDAIAIEIEPFKQFERPHAEQATFRARPTFRTRSTFGTRSTFRTRSTFGTRPTFHLRAAPDIRITFPWGPRFNWPPRSKSTTKSKGTRATLSGGEPHQFTEIEQSVAIPIELLDKLPGACQFITADLTITILVEFAEEGWAATKHSGPTRSGAIAPIA